MITNCGIYCMFFTNLDNKYYIGQSVQLHERILTHLSELKKNTHSNKKLQKAYNKYGVPEVHILEYCSPEVLNSKEIFWIEEFNSYYEGFNNTKGGESMYGEAHPQAKYTKEMYIGILYQLATTNKSLVKLSEELGIEYRVLQLMASGHTHNYLQEEYPDLYKLMIDKKGPSIKNSAKYRGIIYPKVISPAGEILSIDNLNSFCKKYNLQAPNMYRVLKKERQSHKGWKLYES